MKNEKAYKDWRDKQKSRLTKELDEQLPPRNKVSNADDINIKKYRESYRGDSPLDD